MGEVVCIYYIFFFEQVTLRHFFQRLHWYHCDTRLIIEINKLFKLTPSKMGHFSGLKTVQWDARYFIVFFTAWQRNDYTLSYNVTG